MPASFRGDVESGKGSRTRILGFALAPEDLADILAFGWTKIVLTDTARETMDLPDVDEIHFVLATPDQFITAARRTGSIDPKALVVDERKPH